MNVYRVKFLPSLGKIAFNIENSLSKERRKFLILTAIFFVGILALFMTTSWLSISTTRAEFGAAPVDAYPNYFDFMPENLVNMGMYWQSPYYSLVDKVEYVLNTPLLIYGSFDSEYSMLTGAFPVTMGQIISVLSMSILLGVYTNLWLLAKKRGCRIGVATKGTGGVAGGAGGASGIFSMLLLAGCCGGTGISFLLFSLPILGSFFSGFYSNFDTMAVLMISIPSNLLLVGLIAFMASKQVGVSTEQETGKLGTKAWSKVAIYLAVPAIFLTTFAMALYWWNLQSIAAIMSGMTGGQQNTTIALYATLPISSSLFVMSAVVQLRRMFQKPKVMTIST